MLQGRQLGHDRHQTRVLAFHPNLFPNMNFLAFPCKHVVCLVMRTMSASKYPVSQGETRQGDVRGECGWCLVRSVALQGAKKKNQRGVCDGEVE